MKTTVFTFILGLSMVLSSVHAMEWQWLEAMRLSVQQMNYRGEFFHRRGDKTNAYSIVHRYEDGQVQELLRQLDGDMIEVLRSDDRVVCYYPPGSESAINHAIPAAPFSQVFELDLQQISQNYLARSEGDQRVAGVDSHVVVLKGDEWRYSQKFWLEAETNLLLQSELIDSSGHVLEQFRFTRVELGIPILSSELVPSLDQTSARQQTLFRANPVISNDEGFSSVLSWLPSGFVLTHAESRQNAENWLEQRTLSDGLASFSIFIERHQQDVLHQSGVAKMGATTAVMALVDGHSVTVVGEIPATTAKKIVEHLSIDAASI